MQDVTVFNVIVSLLILVFGFLLNRVFTEIDKLHAGISQLRETLPSEYIEKVEFIRHADQEMHMMNELKADMNKRFDKLDILLEAVRVRQQG